MVGGQLQALIVPCKLVHLSAQEKTHPETVMSSCALGQVENTKSLKIIFRENVSEKLNYFFLSSDLNHPETVSVVES